MRGRCVGGVPAFQFHPVPYLQRVRQGVGPGSFRLQVVTLAGETVTQPTLPDYYSLTTTTGINIQRDTFGLNGVAQAQLPEPASLTPLAMGLAGLTMVVRLRRA
jgi:hypothetical protein